MGVCLIHVKFNHMRLYGYGSVPKVSRYSYINVASVTPWKYCSQFVSDQKIMRVHISVRSLVAAVLLLVAIVSSEPILVAEAESPQDTEYVQHELSCLHKSEANKSDWMMCIRGRMRKRLPTYSQLGFANKYWFYSTIAGSSQVSIHHSFAY